MRSIRDIYKIGKGPSSSHTMGPERAARIFKQEHPDAEKFRVVLFDSLAKTGVGHGTDRVLREVLSPVPTEIVFATEDPGNLRHPNTLDFYAVEHAEESAPMRVQSVGGGDIVIEGRASTEDEDVYPENSLAEIVQFCKWRKIRLWEYVEMTEGTEIWTFLAGVWKTMRWAIADGLHAEGVLPGGLHLERKAKLLYQQADRNQLVQVRETRIICAYAFAVSEQNADNGTIVTAPTCGSCGVIPAVFYYMQEDQPKLMAMQSGELDCYNSIDSASLQIYLSDPASYNVVQIAGTRLQFYILNENRLDDKVREAINLTVDKDGIAAYQEGTVSPAVGPFLPTAAYGQVTVPSVDTEKAKQLLEEDGYTLGADGIYEKDGEKLSLNICYYAARNLDAIAILMQEQLKAIGIDSVLTVEEDPDATYISTGDFDVALYCMISDKAGDPLYFLDSTLAEGSYYDCGGFSDDECQAAIEQLRTEADPEVRAELANKAVQIAIDDNAFGYVGLFNQTTVLKPDVHGFAEDIPFDFYGVDAKTDKP